MKTLILIILIGTSIHCLGQKITISGSIVNQWDNSPIAFATISFTKKNSDVTNNRISNENGIFNLTISEPGAYNVKVSHSSFNDFSKIYQIDSTMTIGAINMIMSENSLDLVTIKAKKNLIIRKIDRLVMDVDSNALTAGRSALEVFELAPGVFVDNGSISINGNTGTRVMVNNKLVKLSGNDLVSYLSSLRSDEIKSIEIISHPPAEFSAEGTGGFINIILKKNNISGLNGNIGINYQKGRYSSTSENIALNFKQKKLALFLNYTFSKDKDFQDTEFNRSITSSGVNYFAKTDRIDNYDRHRITTGVIYDLSDRQNISFNFTGSFNNGNASYNSISDIVSLANQDNQKVVGSYPRNIKTNYNNLGLNYDLRLDTLGSSITIISDYTVNDSRTNSSGQSNFYDVNNNLIGDTIFRNNTPSLAHVFTFENKLLKVITTSTKLNMGLKYTNTNIKNSALFENYEDQSWHSDNDKNYIYDFKENISAIYASFNSKISHFDYQLGFRGEYTSTTGSLLSSNIITKRSYFNLFPTAYLKYSINSKKNDYLTFYYGRRIQRPSYTSLNPYEFYADNYLIGRGNPYLNPSFSNSYEVSYVLRNKYSLTFFADKQNGSISQLLKQSESNNLVTISTWENYGSRFNRGFTLYTPFTITDWWTFNSNIILRRETQELQQIIFKKNILSVQIGQIFNLPKQFNVNLNSNYHSGRLAGNMIIGEIIYFNLGVQKKLLNNKINVKLSWNDVFNTNRMKGLIYYNNQSTGKMIQIKQSQTFNIGMTYNFNLGSVFKMRSIERSNKEEQNRLQ